MKQEILDTLTDHLKQSVKVIEDNLKIIKFKDNGKIKYLINFFEISQMNYRTIVEVNGVLISDIVSDIAAQFSVNGLSSRFFQVEYNELPIIRFVTKKQTPIGYKLREDLAGRNIISNEEYNKIQKSIVVGSKEFKDILPEIKDYNDIDYVIKKVQARYEVAYDIDKIDYDLDIKIFDDIYTEEGKRDKFIISNPTLIYKDGSAKIQPGSAKTYYFVEDFHSQLIDNINQLNRLVLQQNNVKMNLFVKMHLGCFEDVQSKHRYNLDGNQNYSKSYLNNAIIVLTKEPEHEEFVKNDLDDPDLLTRKARDEALKMKDKYGASRLSIFAQRLRTNVNIIQLTVKDLFDLKIVKLTKDEQKFYESYFKNLNAISTINWVGKETIDSKKMVSQIAKKVAEAFVDTFVEYDNFIQNKDDLEAEFSSIRIAISRVEYAASTNGNSVSYSSSADSVNMSVGAGSIAQILTSFKRIEEYLKHNNIIEDKRGN